MSVWPAHFPPECPPSHASKLAGAVFRFINGSSPADRDFVSYYEREPEKDWGTQACQARGLSVVHTWSDCDLMRKAIPALRKKRVALAQITTHVGLVANTPSNSCKGHSTWWRAPTPGEVRPLFQTFDEPSEATSE